MQNKIKQVIEHVSSKLSQRLILKNPWDGLGSVTTPEEIHTSMLSNMDSDSVSIFQEEESDEDISPLFLQLVCTIQSKGQMGNCTVRILPTCMGKILLVFIKGESLILGRVPKKIPRKMMILGMDVGS
ncbi:hypothetical protein J6590_061136 [Homalodisca vitripennis]|nr:hypothetical protein J6590_061136 [Homalodisca vitripennis]